MCNPCYWKELNRKSVAKYQNKSRGNHKTTVKVKSIKKTKISLVSKKKQALDKALVKVYEQIAKDRPKVCTGCLQPEGVDIKLSHSHIIPRSRRPDLVVSPANITYHCLSIGNHKGCHERHERHDETLADYNKNMDYIKRVDSEYYNLILLKKDLY